MNLKERTRIIGELEDGVEVIFDNGDSTPHCDVEKRKIYIPYVDELTLSKDKIAKIRGYIDHEKLHIRYTTPNLTYSSELVSELVNWLEDMRILKQPMYLGERQNLQRLMDISYEQYKNSIGKLHKDSARLIDAMFSYQGYEELLDQNKDIITILDTAMLTSNNTEELIPYAEELSKILTLPESDNQKDFFNDEDSLENDLKSLYDDRTNKKNKIEDLKEIRTKQEQFFEYNGEYRPYNKEDKYVTLSKTKEKEYRYVRKDISRVSNKLKTVLKQKLLGKARLGVRDRLRNGSLDLKRLYRSFSDVRVFRKPDDIIKNNVCVGIILDCSGSMGDKLVTAVQTLIVISESLYELKIPFSIITHSTIDLKDVTIMLDPKYNRCMPVKISIVKEFNEDFNKIKYRIGAIQSRGFTIENEAMRYMLRTIGFRNEPKKYIFVISDGNPEDIKDENDIVLANDLTNIVHRCKKSNITLINFCLEYNPMFKFPKVVRVTQENLLTNFVKEFRKVLDLT